jgi:hypothetical protein
MKLNFVSITVIALVLLSSLTAEATKKDRHHHKELVGLGDNCDKHRFCRHGFVCRHIKGRENRVCVKLKKPGEKCSREFLQCIPGYKCAVKDGQYYGICRKKH